jgi:hypothetical protein
MKDSHADQLASGVSGDLGHGVWPSVTLTTIAWKALVVPASLPDTAPIARNINPLVVPMRFAPSDLLKKNRRARGFQPSARRAL